MDDLNHGDLQMARLDPTASRLKYRTERLMLTPLFRFFLRVGLPFAICFFGATYWFSVEENRTAFNLMVADVRAAIENRPEFQVKLMAIDGATPEIAEMIRAELPINFPVSSFELDLDAMQKAVRKLDPVKSARLRIRQGGVLQVEVIERVPAVLKRDETGLYVLDGEGALVGGAPRRAAFAGLPVIAGDIMGDAAGQAFAKAGWIRSGQAPEDLKLTPPEQELARIAEARMRQAVAEVLALHEVSDPIRARIRGFERMGARRWDVVLDRGQRVLLPETGAVQAFERVIAMTLTPGVDLLARDLVVVDLRLPQRPTLRMSDEATQEMWRIKALEAGGE